MRGLQPAAIPSDLALTDADLARMTDAQLADLEDRLLLANELDTSKGAQLTVGRVVVFLLSAVAWGFFLTLLSRLPTQSLGVLNIPLYLATLGAGIVTGHALWSVAGRRLRFAVRWVLGHWPTALYVGGAIYQLVGRTP
jgi:hypothetical protein